jgi:uroporphyrinogen III methyltransferase/synthase
MNVANNKGKVWLVGAGPSDAGLITVKGLNAIKNADVVVYDNLVGVEILNFIPSTAKKIDVGKHSGNHPVSQYQINEILLNEALEGNCVVRLKGGDPFLFGRGGEELELLCEYNIDFEIIPGITSALSVPAYAGIPVTHRDFCSSLHIITGHAKLGESPKIDYEALVRLNGTLVFLMSVSSIKDICGGLISAGMAKDMPAAVIENGTKATQRKIISTILCLSDDAKQNNIKSPSIIIVGKVCSLSDKFEWISKRPLHGKRIVVTRPENLCSKLSEKIRSLGGESIEFPCIKTQPVLDCSLLIEAIYNINAYNWLVFTSATGVEFFFDKFIQTGKDIRQLYGLKIAVIGSATEKAFNCRGIKVDFTPSEYNAKALALGLLSILKPDEKVLVLRAKEGSMELNDIFSNAQIDYSDVPIYETVYSAEANSFSLEIIESGQYDMAAFTSASTVKGFVNALPNLDYTQVLAVCIGQETAKEASKYGMKTVISQKATLNSMVEIMVNQ